MRARLAAVIVALMWASLARAAPEPTVEARTLFDDWLAAQNAGDFAAYEKLYGADFTGVRRSGPRTVALDRAGWLKERQRMFAKPMKVTATNVLVFASPRSARIVFTQDWASGTYHDVGNKQLILRRRPDGFRIQREELFSSRVPGKFDPEAFARFAFVVDGAAVVLTNPPDDWGGGPVGRPRYGKDLIARASRPVAPAKLTPALRGLVGKSVVVGDANGQRCTAKLARLELRARALVGSEPEANDAWSMGSKTLVAVLAGDTPCIRNASWARAADQPPLPIAAATAPGEELKRRALAAFSSLPAAVEIQQRFASWFASEQGAGKPAPAWVRGEGAKPLVRTLQLAGGPRFVSVSAILNAGNCDNGVFESMWAIWEVEPGTDRLLPRSETNGTLFVLSPTAIADVDGDGKPEILFAESNLGDVDMAGRAETIDRGLVRAHDGVYMDVEGLPIPDFICPC